MLITTYNDKLQKVSIPLSEGHIHAAVNYENTRKFSY